MLDPRGYIARMQPQVLGSGRRYRTSEVLNQDDLGVLWAGSDALTGEAVTVRIMHERVAADPHRLQLVSERLRRLQLAPPSPHLARLLDHDLRRLGGRQAFAVFATSGEPLAVRLERSGPLQTGPALGVVAAVAEGLAAAHAARVVHGALTPASVLVHEDGEVSVIDVGLGELLSGPSDRRRAGAQGDAAEREAADVLAVTVLFERLLGIVPAPVPTDADGPRPWERDVDPEILPALRQASSPHRRLRPTMSDLAAALAVLGTGAGLEGPAATEAAPAVAPPVGEEAPPAPVATPVPVATRAAAERPAAAVAVRPPAPVAAPAPAPPRRRLALVVAIIAVAVASVAAGMLALGGGGDEAPPSQSPSASPSVSATASPTPTSTIVRATVPDTLGLPVLEATELLESAGLVVGATTAVPGELDVVVSTDPTPGEAVVAGTEVDLLVGDGSEA
jgi:serine/threonine-protein kinase